MVIICKFCSREFTYKSNLNTHQKKAKYCLEKRGISAELVFCNYCNIGFLTKRQLKNHMIKCTPKIIEREQKEKDEKETEISSLKEICKKLISVVEKIAIAGINKPANTVTIIKNLNLKPLTKECFTEGAKLLKRGDLINGSQSITNFLYETILKDKVVCSDTSRNTFRFIDEKGKMIVDKRGTKTIRDFFYSIKEPCFLILHTTEESLYNLKNIKSGLESISKGETNHELLKDIKNTMTKHLPYINFKDKII